MIRKLMEQEKPEITELTKETTQNRLMRSTDPNLAYPAEQVRTSLIC